MLIVIVRLLNGKYPRHFLLNFYQLKKNIFFIK